MRIKTKIIMANIITVCLPIAFTLSFWICYSRSTDFERTRPIKFQNIYSQYKKSLSDVDWKKVSENPEEADWNGGLEIVSELYESGVRFKIVSDGGILFSNLTEGDEDSFCASVEKLVGNNICFLEHGDRYFLFDKLVDGESGYRILVIHDTGLARSKVKKSFVPIYMIPGSFMIVFVSLLILLILVTGMAVTVWLGNSVLIPLDIFQKGTEEIANGNLNHKLLYDNKDEFGDAVKGLDKMRMSLRDSEKKQMGYEENRKSILLGISHDLRSPLTSIKGYACGLKDGIARTEEKKKFYYDAIIVRTGDMENMVDRLYELLRFDIDINLMRFERRSLNRFIETFLEDKKLFLEENRVGVVLDFSDDIVLSFDDFEMGRVLVNLIENSIKYRTAETSLITIRLSEKDGMAELVFKDDGPGVADEYLEKIFEIFYKIDESRSASEKGNGLGLAIIKKIIEGHGGTVKAFNDSGLGFMIKLPVAVEGDGLEKDFDS